MGEIQPYRGAAPPPELVQRAKLLLASSNAIALAGNGAPGPEVAASLTDDERAALPVALADVRRDLAPLTLDDEETSSVIVFELVRASTLMQPQLDEQKRGDWVQMVQEELLGEPHRLVAEGIRRARRVCKFPSEIVPTILAYVEPAKRRLVEQETRYLEIQRASEGETR